LYKTITYIQAKNYKSEERFGVASLFIKAEQHTLNNNSNSSNNKGQQFGTLKSR